MPEQLTLKLPEQLCGFCRERKVALLCDGRIDGASCDAPMCKAWAKNIGWVHVRLSRRDAQGRRCITDTRDLCPSCQARQTLEVMHA